MSRRVYVTDTVDRSLWFGAFLVCAVIGWAWQTAERVYDAHYPHWDGGR